MNFWETLWKIVFFAGIGLFAGMAVWVTIYGARDIKKMFKNITNQHEQETE